MQINIGIIRRCEQSFLRERLSTCQLKPVDSVVLTALDRHGQCNQDTLCSIVNIDKGRMARVMERLEGRSLIRRLINPDNKREKLIEMTEQGKQMLEIINSFSKEWNDQEKNEYQGYLERIARNALAGKENLEND